MGKVEERLWSIIRNFATLGKEQPAMLVNAVRIIELQEMVDKQLEASGKSMFSQFSDPYQSYRPSLLQCIILTILPVHKMTFGGAIATLLFAMPNCLVKASVFSFLQTARLMQDSGGGHVSRVMLNMSCRRYAGHPAKAVPQAVRAADWHEHPGQFCAAAAGLRTANGRRRKHRQAHGAHKHRSH